jgi:hypothetical protein
VALLSLLAAESAAFIPSIPQTHHQAAFHSNHPLLSPHISCRLAAKKRKKDSSEEDEDEWYSPINSNASPDTVFWDEMERRRLLNTSYEDGQPAGGGESPLDMIGKIGMDSQDDLPGPSSVSSMSSTGVASTIASQSMGGENLYTSSTVGSSAMSTKNPGVTVAEERSAEATLANYAVYAVSDNYLYDEDEEEEALKAMGIRNDMSLWEGDDPTLEEENAELERQLDEWEKELFGDGIDGSVVGGSSPFFDPALSDEPWDRYGQSKSSDDDENMSAFQKNLQRKIELVRKSHKELLLDYDDDHPEEAEADSAREEEEYVKSLSSIGITSPRLENAAVNPKAEAFFKRAPDELQGYDTMWVSAIDEPCLENLHGIFMDYGKHRICTIFCLCNILICSLFYSQVFSLQTILEIGSWDPKKMG